MSDLNRIIDELSSLTLLEASQLAKMLRTAWGITETVAPIMRPADRLVSVVEQAVEQEYFSVTLADIGPRKIEVIKVLRQLSSLGLKEAKDLAETPNAKVLEGVDKSVAQDARLRLEQAGAVVVIA